MHVGVFLIQCFFYPSDLSLCLSVDHFCLVPWHGLWWLTCELHCSPLTWRLRSVYQLWKSPLLSCVPRSSDRTSCLSLQHMACRAVLATGQMDKRATLDQEDRHRCAWIGMQDPTNSATHGTRWFPGHVLHRAVNNQDVINMSDGHRNVVIR